METLVTNLVKNGNGRVRGAAVVQLLTGCANKTPKEVVDTIITDVKQYAGNMEQSDDLTLLVIRRS